MKKIILSLMAASAAVWLVSASAQPTPDENTNSVPVPEIPAPAPGNDAGNGGPPPDNAGPPENGAPQDAGPDAAALDEKSGVRAPLVITPSQGRPAPTEEIQSDFLPPTQKGTNVNDLNLNFNHAPLEMVLNYLSDAAGFIIVQDTRVNGTVTINGRHLTQDEAVDLLNSVLNQNGCAAIRSGRTLTIVDKNDAKTRAIPVRTGNNPAEIPDNAEIVTQIIPIRFVEARQLVSDLSSFVSPQATVVANEAGNSVVITDTQSNIRHLMEIIQAIDNSAEAETEIRVFALKYASPTDVATELGSIFPSSTSGSGTQSPIRFGGRGAGGPGAFFRNMMAGGASGGDNSADRIKKATQVTAVADTRIQAVIVTAPKDLMEQIASMMKDLDVPSDRDQNVYVFQTKNGDPQQMVSVLQSMFQGSSTSRGGASSSSQTSALQTRANNNTTTSGSTSSSSSSGIGGGRTGGGGGGGRSY